MIQSYLQIKTIIIYGPDITYYHYYHVTIVSVRACAYKYKYALAQLCVHALAAAATINTLHAIAVHYYVFDIIIIQL